jgi:hypothetical protein
MSSRAARGLYPGLFGNNFLHHISPNDNESDSITGRRSGTFNQTFQETR